MANFGNAIMGFFSGGATGGGGGTSTGVNGLNGTTNIGLGGTLTSSTTITATGFDFLILDSNSFTFQSNSNNSTSTIQIQGDNNFSQVTDNISSLYCTITQTANEIYTDKNGTEIGLKLDFLNSTFNLGDYNGSVHNTALVIDDTNYKLYTNGSNGSNIGLDFDFLSETYSLGDSNFAIITCDNINSNIELTATNIILNNTPQINNATITTSATSTIPSNYLSIQINGANYKILLFNP